MFDEKLEDVDGVEQLLSIYRKLQKRARKTEERIAKDAPDDYSMLLQAYKYIESVHSRIKDLKKELELLIAEEFPTKDEGSTTTEYGDFKVKTTGRRYYNVDKDQLEDADLSEIGEAVFRDKKKVRKSALKDLKKVDPDEFHKVMECISISEGKPGVNVEYKEG